MRLGLPARHMLLPGLRPQPRRVRDLLKDGRDRKRPRPQRLGDAQQLGRHAALPHNVVVGDDEVRRCGSVGGRKAPRVVDVPEPALDEEHGGARARLQNAADHADLAAGKGGVVGWACSSVGF